MRSRLENLVSLLAALAVACTAVGEETASKNDPAELPVKVEEGSGTVSSAPTEKKDGDSGAAAPSIREEDRQAALEFLGRFQEAWLDFDIAALYRYLPATGRTPEPVDRLEFLMNIFALHGQGMSGVLDPATIESVTDDKVAFRGQLITETGQSMAEVAVVLQRKPEGWRMAEIGIGLDTGDLPDVFDPNGAFIPVNESQF